MLLLGGFTIAAALSKYNIAKMMATFVLSKAGTKPRTVEAQLIAGGRESLGPPPLTALYYAKGPTKEWPAKLH